MKFETIALFDALTKIALIICVTYAACYFNNWWLMFFCLMAGLFGHSFETTRERKHDGEK